MGYQNTEPLSMTGQRNEGLSGTNRSSAKKKSLLERHRGTLSRQGHKNGRKTSHVSPPGTNWRRRDRQTISRQNWFWAEDEWKYFTTPKIAKRLHASIVSPCSVFVCQPFCLFFFDGVLSSASSCPAGSNSHSIDSVTGHANR